MKRDENPTDEELIKKMLNDYDNSPLISENLPVEKYGFPLGLKDDDKIVINESKRIDT
jgi:hypothetical protein